MEINEHCRLCLVKDEVNIPIFEDEGDVRQVLLKITACLPVKIAKTDSLPKRICDGCLYKLESFYQFWNTSVSSEKQLLQWLSETLNGDAEANLHALKQEPTDNLQTESQVFIQQQLAYQGTENYGDYHEETNYKPKKTSTKKERDREKRERERERKREEAEAEEEAPAPKRKRRAATKKPAIEIDDDDDDEEYVPPSASITKTEDDSEGNDDPGEDYGGDDNDNASDENLDDETEPGPSGTTKSTSDAPYSRKWKRISTTWTVDDNSDFRKYQLKYHLKKAVVLVGGMRKFSSSKYPLVFINAKLGKLAINPEPKYGLEVSNIIASTRNKYKCEVCALRFQTYIELKYHVIIHEDEDNQSHQGSPSNVEQYPITVTALAGTKPSLSDDKSPNWKVSSAKHLCEVCGANFDNHARYDAHVILHKKFSCTNCSARFSTSSELVAHAMEIHNIVYEAIIQQKPVKEAIESETNKERSSLNHSEAEVLKYRCKVCSRRFADCFQLQRHKRMHSKDAKVTEEKQVTKVGCDLCNLEFSLKDDMLKHRREHLKPINTGDDDEIVVVNMFGASEPVNPVINLDSSDSENEIIFNPVPTNKPEYTAVVTIPIPKEFVPVTSVINTTGSSLKSVQRNDSITVTNDNTVSVSQKIVKHPISSEPSKIINEKAKSGVTIRCIVCNFITTNEDIMQEHHKVHSISNILAAAPATNIVQNATLVARINQNLNQVTNIVTKASENSALEADYINTITTTTITTPSSIDASPSTSWGNQLVFISPSNTGSQIIQHPIFIIPGSNSSNNTSNVDINIRTTNQPNTSPKPSDTNKLVSVKARSLTRPILPAPAPVKKSFPKRETTVPTIISPPPLSDSITFFNTIMDETLTPISKYTIKVINEVEGDKLHELVAAPCNANQENRYILVEELPVQNTEQQGVDVTHDESTAYDTAIGSMTTKSAVSESDSASPVVIQMPKIFVKPLSLLMKSPLKNNAVEIRPASVPDPAIFKTPLNPCTSSVETGDIEAARAVALPKLTAISKAQLIDLMTKKTVINKAMLPTVNVSLKSLNDTSSGITDSVATARPPVPPIVIPTSTESTTPTTKIIPKKSKATSKKLITIPASTKTSSKSAESSKAYTESVPLTERSVHKCESCSYEAKKRSKLNMHCKFKCRMCQFITCKLNNLDTHYESLHAVQHICCPCNMVFSDNSALLEHKNQIHICPNCDKCQIDLPKHVNGFKCPLCTYTSCKQNALNAHYKATHNIIRNCAPCNIAFGSVADFEDHKYSMHFCSKCRTYKMNLNVHQTFCRGDGVKILDRVESQRNLEVIELD